jgi:O-Antigen ligase
MDVAPSERSAAHSRRVSVTANQFLVALPLAALIAVMLGEGFANGGFSPPSWGWSAVALCAVAAFVVVAAAYPPLDWRGTLLWAAWLGVFAWTALSTIWSPSVTQSMLEAERALLYTAAALAAVLVAGLLSRLAVVSGVAVAAVLIANYSTLTRLLPGRFASNDVFGGYRLSNPIGYWNGLGIVATAGIILALSIAVFASSLTRRCLAAATLPGTALCLYFTYSRGAWLALLFGAAIVVVLVPRRLRLAAAGLLILVPSAGAVWLASRQPGLTHVGVALATAERQGHATLWKLGLFAIVSVAVVAGLAFVERFHVPAVVRWGWATLLVVAAVGATAAGLAHEGGPRGVWRHARHSIAAPPVSADQHSGNLNARLFSLSNNGRLELWHAARTDFAAHRLAGSGAGTFAQYWLQHRHSNQFVRDVHNLYLQTAAELGIVGLVLLTIALAAPLAVVRSWRKQPILVAGAGAYSAILAHAAVDWDYQLPGVMLLAIVLAGALVTRGGEGAGVFRSRRRTLPIRAVVLTVLFGIAAVAAAGYIGNSAIAKSDTAAARHDWSQALAAARQAKTWAPWSAEPLERIAVASLGAGDRTTARTYLQRAAARDPSNWLYWAELSLVSTGREQASANHKASILNPKRWPISILP